MKYKSLIYNVLYTIKDDQEEKTVTWDIDDSMKLSEMDKDFQSVFQEICEYGMARFDNVLVTYIEEFDKLMINYL